jgi:hypothetical protein
MNDIKCSVFVMNNFFTEQAITDKPGKLISTNFDALILWVEILTFFKLNSLR